MRDGDDWWRPRLQGQLLLQRSPSDEEPDQQSYRSYHKSGQGQPVDEYPPFEASYCLKEVRLGYQVALPFPDGLNDGFGLTGLHPCLLQSTSGSQGVERPCHVLTLPCPIRKSMGPIVIWGVVEALYNPGLLRAIAVEAGVDCSGRFGVVRRVGSSEPMRMWNRVEDCFRGRRTAVAAAGAGTLSIRKVIRSTAGSTKLEGHVLLTAHNTLPRMCASWARRAYGA